MTEEQLQYTIIGADSIVYLNDENRIEQLKEQFAENENRMISIKDEMSQIDSQLKGMEDSTLELKRTERTIRQQYDIRTKLDVRKDKIEKDTKFFFSKKRRIWGKSWNPTIFFIIIFNPSHRW